MTEQSQTPMNEDALEETITHTILGDGTKSVSILDAASSHPEDQNPLLKAIDLGVTFTTSAGVVPAVRSANLTIYPGQTAAIVDESGFGKSITIAAAIGLLPGINKVTGGAIEFAGEGTAHLSSKGQVHPQGSGIGLALQDPVSNLSPVPKVDTQAEKALTASNVIPSTETRARVAELLERAGLPDVECHAKQFPHEFPSGMHQRVLIATGIAARPKLLIADEPVPTLGVTVQRRILDHLGTLTRDLGTAVLFITRSLSLTAKRAKQLVVMHRGHIIESGPALDILQHPRHLYTRHLVSAAPPLASVHIESAHARGINVTDEELIGAGKRSILTEETMRVEDLAREFDIRGSKGEAKKLLAVDNVSLALRCGTILAVVDKSGSGKSIAANMVLQFLSPTSGTVFFDGQDTSQVNDEEPFALHRRLQAVFRNPYGSLDPILSIPRVIEEPLRAHGYDTLAYAGQEYTRAMKTGRDPEERVTTLVDAKKVRRELSSVEKNEFNPKKLRVKRVSELLDVAALPRSAMHHYPNELPGGQRQHAAVARALVSNPEVIVLDEAASVLDILVQSQILYLLNDLQARLDLSYLLITYDLAVVRQIIDDVVAMEKSRLVEKNTTDILFANPVQDYTRKLIEAVPGRKIRLDL